MSMRLRVYMPDAYARLSKSSGLLRHRVIPFEHSVEDLSMQVEDLITKTVECCEAGDSLKRAAHAHAFDFIPSNTRGSKPKSSWGRMASYQELPT
jgi:hypothetical protein